MIYLVQINFKHSPRWETHMAAADTFGEAACKAVIAAVKALNLDVREVPCRAEYRDHGDYQDVAFYYTDLYQSACGLHHAGEIWFTQRVKQGCEDDCETCAGTGEDPDSGLFACEVCGPWQERYSTAFAEGQAARDAKRARRRRRIAA
jgi:hypothetical protein